jgi:23S rRNA pseudouridine2604 synthase
VRLNKYISESGACSRREADDRIAAGRVTVNGAVAQVGAVVEADDEVRVDGEPLGKPRKLAKPVTIALNKPTGVTCTTDRAVKDNIIDFVDHAERIFPIGRLDRDSEGLILLTNDGDLVNHVLRAEHQHEKEYVVAVDRPINDAALAEMARGVRILGQRTLPCRIRRVDGRVYRVILTQGLNRQLRRMAEAVGYRVVALQRIRVMNVHLGSLKLGRWRNLTPAELAGLRAGGGKPRR